MADDATHFGENLADLYDRHLGPVFFEAFGRLMAARVAESTPRRVLETAGGSGMVTVPLRAALGHDAALTATDLSQPMLDVAARRLGETPGVVLRRADALDLPFPDQSFDAVVCQFGFMFFPDKARALAEAFRVLAPGGRLHLSVWDSLAANPSALVAHEAVAALYDHDPVVFFPLPYGSHRLDPIRDGLEAAGFTGVRIDVLDHVETVAEPAGFARGLVAGTPLGDRIRQRGTPTVDTATDAVAAALVRRFGPGPIAVPLRAIFFAAHRPA